MSHDEEAADERGPVRRCIVTRTHAAPSAMIRFVVSPERVVTPDLAARLPGRGMWLSARRDVLDTAALRGVFARSARGPVTIPAELGAILQDGLLRRIADLLGLARRAGQAVGGYGKAREWIVSGKAGLVVQASDGSREERSRLVSGARALPVVSCLTGTKLGAAFGRDHMVHGAVMAGALADRIIAEHGRYAGLAEAVPLEQADI
ncbi:RNA-binding protein [Lichenicoccus sp.]|uniref:RNA-binding protein n=1 Tax=Lichenicoccus sp. TaxID=2781899 RepID=UPI003D10D7D3